MLSRLWPRPTGRHVIARLVGSTVRDDVRHRRQHVAVNALQLVEIEPSRNAAHLGLSQQARCHGAGERPGGIHWEIRPPLETQRFCVKETTRCWAADDPTGFPSRYCRCQSSNTSSCQRRSV